MTEIDLLGIIGQDIQETNGTRKLTIKGKTENYKVYRIPLTYLYYNELNGRIATNISRHTDEHGQLSLDNIESYNETIHEFIVNSNAVALRNTKNNIDKFGQRVAGVVLKNGRIVDGNRRFTCLRELHKESGKDYYFEAVILDTDKGISQKDIKRLELNLQHAEEKPVDYNPIDNLVDVYRDLVENETFTVKEYAANTNKKDKEVEKLKAEAILMVEYLEFINAKGKFYIARDLNLDGPLQEIMTILKRTSDNQKEAVKDTLFTAIFTSSGGDLTRHIRSIGKDILKSKSVNEFLNEYEDIVEKVHDTIQSTPINSIQDLAKASKDLSEVKEEGNKIINKKLEASRTESARNKPIDLLSNAFDLLDAIDSVALSHMDDESKNDFKEILDKVQFTIKLFEEKM
ncbi:hypothetical protein [Ectobacillus sp. sgz5001026]|uniref:hypothetical protein n=1 Tax=Ectobacillus sp. sgz5001026 TaxID=3242473 RepID=UPI0036D2C531